MVKIGLEGMQFHSFHGYYTEEQSVGNQYSLDVTLQMDLNPELLNDALENTINYEEIYHICQLEMNNPRHLIETVAQDIIKKLKHKYPSIRTLTVRIRKMNPLLGGLVDGAVVEISD